ncbi:MAG: 16S rRNA (cytidine(1402)-2'-O)-methyltransferase [Gammaproteobacteria bacterium]|nr:16S rRNA (cytidine(1402)-2'-O)-methyltransferase [Gammaproteobacteria bacterium]
MSITKGALYVVATPIGNLADMTTRGTEVLAAVDLIAAEDTRHSAPLLRHFSINTPCQALHEHNEKAICARIIARLQSGESVALISDAGTPLVSDPGYHLVSAAHECSLPIIPIPGACALITALSASGLPTNRFSYEGFLPAKSSARKRHLETLADDPRTLVFYEAPHRIKASLADMQEVFGGGRVAVLGRELTKRFETIRRDSLAELLSWVEADPNQQKGEIVVLVHGAAKEAQSTETAEGERVLRLLLAELPLKQAVSLTTTITGGKRNALYRSAMVINNEDSACTDQAGPD